MTATATATATSTTTSAMDISHPKRIVHEVIEKKPNEKRQQPFLESPNRPDDDPKTQPEDTRLFKAISMLKPSGKFSLVFD